MVRPTWRQSVASGLNFEQASFHFRGAAQTIKIVLTSDADQCEQSIATRIGEGGTHTMWRRGFGNRTDRPI